MAEPKRITSGNSCEWDRSFSKYSVSDGWAISYSIVNNQNQFQVSTTESGGVFTAVITATFSKTIPEGRYRLIGYAVNSGEDKRETFYNEDLIVRPDFSQISDLRSNAEITLEAIEATIRKTATKDQQSITIDGETLARRSVEDLLKLLDRFKREVRLEKRARKARRLGKKSGRIGLRFK